MIKKPIKRISFDFDGVLSSKEGQSLAARKIREGYEVWILTARQPENDKMVREVAKELGIPESRIIFTGGQDKWKYVEKKDIDQHYDNNVEQIAKINKNTNATGTIYHAQK